MGTESTAFHIDCRRCNGVERGFKEGSQRAMRGRPVRCETLGDGSTGVQGCVLNSVEREMDESWWMAEFHFGVSQEQRDGILDKASCYNSLAKCTLTPELQPCHKERGSVLQSNVITLFFHCSSGKIPIHQISFRVGQTFWSAGIPAPTTENTIW